MKPAAPVPTNGKTPLERMTDLTRRIVAVPKSELLTKATRTTKRRKKK